MVDQAEERQRAVVERLYAVFAAPVPRHITGCPCCIDRRETDKLLGTPLRVIDGNMLWSYVFSAFLTLGDVADFRYFLPRIFEFSIRHPYDAVDVEIVLGKLRLAGWDRWVGEERAAVIAAIDLLFDQAVAAVDEEEMLGLVAIDVASVLCGAARADLDPVRWLDRFRDTAGMLLLRHLREELWNKPNGFWEDAPVGLQLARAWLAQNVAAD